MINIRVVFFLLSKKIIFSFKAFLFIVLISMLILSYIMCFLKLNIYNLHISKLSKSWDTYLINIREREREREREMKRTVCTFYKID